MKKESRKKHDQVDVHKGVSFTGEEEAAEKDLEDIQHEELSGLTHEEEDLTQTETDEDEGEGLGDGNLGKSKEDIAGQ